MVQDGSRPQVPECRDCGRPMTYSGEVPRLGGRDGRRFFSCTACGRVADIVIPAPPRADPEPA
jgi:hypothetical protein